MVKRRAKLPEEGLTPEERERRRLQKELQAKAMQLRSEGGIYKPQKHKRKVIKDHKIERGELKKGQNSRSQDKKKTSSSGRDPAAAKDGKPSKHGTPTWRPYDTPDVVIIPIFWNMHAEEKTQVMAAADTVSGLLKEAGLSTLVDAANQYTPGQKMKYWETAGVKVRVEIGPKEATAGTAVVARAGEPGTVAHKTTVNVAVQVVREVQGALTEEGRPPQGDAAEQQAVGQGGTAAHPRTSTQLGDRDHKDALAHRAVTGVAEGPSGRAQASDQPDAEPPQHKLPKGTNVKEGSRRDKKRRAAEARAAAVATGGSGSAVTGVAVEPDSGDPCAEGEQAHTTQQVHISASTGAAAALTSAGQHQQQSSVPNGDDLQDDFDIAPEFLDTAEEDALTLTKTQRLKKQKKQEKDRRKKQRYGNLEAWDADQQPQQQQQQGAGVGVVAKQKLGAGKSMAKAKVVVF